jgi:hypothetical protein
MPNTHTKTPLRTGFLRSLIRWLVIGVVLLWSLAALILVAARWIDLPTTAVHIQRRLRPGFTTRRIAKCVLDSCEICVLEKWGEVRRRCEQVGRLTHAGELL